MRTLTPSKTEPPALAAALARFYYEEITLTHPAAPGIGSREDV